MANPRLTYLLVLLALAALAPAQARAQDLGSTGMAMGAAGAMETNPMQGGQQQLNRASALTGQNQNAPAATPAQPPPAAAVVAATPPAAAAPQSGQPPATPAPAAAAGASAAAAAAPATPGTPPQTAAIDLHSPFHDSLFFSPQDLIEIQKASQHKTAPGIPGSPNASQPVIPLVRKIIVSGVLYNGPDRWIVWLNGQKVTPQIWLKEIVDIKVEKDLIHLRWFDIGKNGVINITMRPHETYDIVTGVLLPG